MHNGLYLIILYLPSYVFATSTISFYSKTYTIEIILTDGDTCSFYQAHFETKDTLVYLNRSDFDTLEFNYNDKIIYLKYSDHKLKLFPPSFILKGKGNKVNLFIGDKKYRLKSDWER